jgi:hypothetical protein
MSSPCDWPARLHAPDGVPLRAREDQAAPAAEAWGWLWLAMHLPWAGSTPQMKLASLPHICFLEGHDISLHTVPWPFPPYLCFKIARADSTHLTGQQESLLTLSGSATLHPQNHLVLTELLPEFPTGAQPLEFAFPASCSWCGEHILRTITKENISTAIHLHSFWFTYVCFM